MLFKKIEMHGFKSFAEPVTIEFNEGITGIVGPNGSGKSNISDAIRWVLGEQSPKMLRGGKMEEVIFNGTSTRKSRGMAEVTLVIDNSDQTLPIDYKEVAITRRMFRSGESEYHINGNQCRLRDIRELIMDTGIGVDGYSIIGQGKISDIISNKTESRRLIFEEAAGIVAYKSKKAEAEKKLASTSANMERLQDVIGEIENRIEGLREDSVKATEYLGLRDRHKELEINIILKNVENLELKNEYTKDDIMELASKLENLADRKKEIDDKVAEGNSRNEALEKLSVEAREALIKAIDELNAAVNKSELDKERMAAIKKDEQRISEEIQDLNIKLESEKANKENFAVDKEQIDTDAKAAELALSEKVGDYNSLSDEMAQLAEEVDKNKEIMFKSSSLISSSEAEIGSLKLLQETLERRKTSLLDDKLKGEDTNRETLDELNVIKRERNNLADDVAERKSELDELRQRINEYTAEEKELVKQSEELRIGLGRTSARKKTIEEMESNYEGYNFAVKHVMKSGLGGIHGVVADLIDVPKGYETAIETALGAALQNIVCEDDESAKRAIRSLKENKAGRMTFLPLSSIRVGKSRTPDAPSEKGFVGFGPECVTFDDKYSEVIEYLLGRVVIVDTMDNAVRISKKLRGMRIVTLEGEIINAGGAITGGKYKNKTANILDRKAEINELADKIQTMEAEYNKVSGRLETVRAEGSKLTGEIGKGQDALRQAENELMIRDNEIRIAEGALLDIKTSGDKIEAELDSIAKEQEKSNQLIGSLRNKIETARKESAEAERNGEAILEEYESKKAVFDKIAEEITEARIAVTSCENRREHAEEMLKRIQDAVLEVETGIADRENQLTSIKAEMEVLTSGHSDVDEKLADKEAAKENAEVYLSDITNEKAALSAELSEIVKEKEEIDNTVTTLQNQKYELDLRQAKNETQLENYKEKLWEDFEVSYIQAMEFKSEEFNMATAVKENRVIKNRIKELGEVNVGAIKEYETVKERYEFLSGERADIQSAMDNLTGIIGDMDKTIKAKFKESFDNIVINFENQFKRLFAGGHAELRLSDANNPLESDIDIVAQPPGKKLQNINLLSGGEKTLTAIALMFAVLEAKPTPFCILDEVEAALDDANIDRFISCLRQFNGIQFALVTHQKSTMEHSDVLYGVTMPEKGVSKVLSLSLEDNLDEYSA
ncbi:MAG: chromosome segregation protein SMC [Firmicutes bacterium]|nr:chromosome segregation protein SMC [Bacillota bacterium]